MRAKIQTGEQQLLISVDAYADKIMAGRVWNEQTGSETKFTGLMQLLLLINKAVSELRRFPEERCKSFTRPDSEEKSVQQEPVDPTRGALATFQLRVLFRQNMSWQGLLTWVESRQEESFRSALEFSMLLNSALSFASEAKSNVCGRGREGGTG